MNNKDKIILEKLVDLYGADIIFEDMSKGRIKSKALAAAIALGMLPGIVGGGNYIRDTKSSDLAASRDSAIQYVEKMKIQKELQKTRQQQINAISDYIYKAVSAQKENPDNVKLTPEHILACAQEYNYDIPLLLAQAHQESCFGITPRAQKTNSVFSVGLWDNGVNKKTYETQNASVAPYIELMQNDYLTNKTVDDILHTGNFVNYDGKRYARDPNYEAKIRSLRNKIIREYPILKDAHMDYFVPDVSYSENADIS